MIGWRYDAQCYLDQDLDENGNVWGKGWMQPEPEEVDEKRVMMILRRKGSQIGYYLIRV